MTTRACRTTAGAALRSSSGPRWVPRPAAPRSPAPTPSCLGRRDLLGMGAASLTTTLAVPHPPNAPLLASSSAAMDPTVAAAAVDAATVVAPPAPPPTEIDANGVLRLKLQPEGWNTWRWRGHNINWLAAGDSGPAVVLVHGFGASAYHWRYVVPELSRHCRVFAIDVLGFGWSDKPSVDYDGYAVWTDQLRDFVSHVVRPLSEDSNEKVIMVGNSMGGYNALATAAAAPDLVKGVVLMNAAGRFEDPAAGGSADDAGDASAAPAADAAAAAAPDSIVERAIASVSSAIKRAVISASFVFTKQPLRVKSVLGSVYVDKTNIDDDLVRSILIPAEDPNAMDVFYRVITAKGIPMNRLLDSLDGKMPMLLLWGSEDPWCVPARATQIQQHYPQAQRIDIVSGHCPHDDTPALVNPPLLEWVQSLDA